MPTKPLTVQQLLVDAPLDDAQKNWASLILTRFLQAGYSPAVAMGAVANAWAESRLDPSAVYGFAPWTGSNHIPAPGAEGSAGLFMLNPAARAAGAGMSLAQRKNPEQNIARILEVLKRIEQTAGPVVSSAATASAAASAFCAWVERPANSALRAIERAGYAEKLFPSWANVLSLPEIAVGTTGLLGMGMLALASLALWLGLRAFGVVR